jgi:hypothetical protein
MEEVLRNDDEEAPYEESGEIFREGHSLYWLYVKVYA